MSIPQFYLTQKGRLVNARPDPDSLEQGVHSRALITLRSLSSTGLPVDTVVSVPLNALRKSEFLSTFLSQDLWRGLQQGQPLPSNVVRSLTNQYNLEVEVDMETTGRTFHYGNSYSNPQAGGRAADIRLRPLTAEEQERQTGTPGMGVADQWPAEDEPTPFTPIRVPFTRLDSLQGKTRVGYAVIGAPIEHFSMTRDTRMDAKPALRQAGTMKKHTGFAYESYTLSWTAHGPEEIKHSVQDVLEQFSLFPFLSADGGPFGHPGEYGPIPKSVALRSFTISTVEGLPNALNVNLSLDPFIWSFYIQPLWGDIKIQEMDDAICWPLMKIWCKSRSKSSFHGQEFNGRFQLRFPDPALSDAIRKLNKTQRLGEEVVTDLAMLNTALHGLVQGNSGFIKSRNAKVISRNVIQDPDTTKLLALKFEDSALFNEVHSKNLDIGWIDWFNRIGYHNYSSSDGLFLPESAMITEQYLQRSLDAGTLKPVEIDTTDIPVADIVIGNGDITEQIQQHVDRQIAELNPSSITYQSELSRLRSERIDRVNNPAQYYALLIPVNSSNRSEVEKVLQRLISENEAKIGIRYQSLKKLNEIASSSSDTESLRVLLDASIESPDILIERISASKNHNLAVTSFRGNSLPLHQHIGGMDSIMIVEGQCFSLQALQSLRQVKEEFDKRNLQKVSRKFVADAGGQHKTKEIMSSFMYVDNEIFHLMGVFFVMPLNFHLEPVEGVPDTWTWSMSFVEYDPTQFFQEEIRFMDTYMSQLGRVYRQGWASSDPLRELPLLQRAEEYFSLQDSLRDEEVYPDLRLPTQDEFRGWVTTCRQLAEDYLHTSDSQKMVSKGKTEANLSVFEQEVLLHLRQFLNTDTARKISKWKDFAGYNRPGTAIGRYVDPDFFIYYAMENRWSTNFDQIALKVMGKPDRNNRAQGVMDLPEGTVDIQSNLRFWDPTMQGAVSVSSPNYFASIDQAMGRELETLYNQTYIPHASNPSEAANALKAEITKKVEEFDNRQRWWPTINGMRVSVDNPGLEGSIQLSPEQVEAFEGMILDSTSRNFQKELSEEGLAGADTSTPTSTLGFDEIPSQTAKDAFLDLSWRQAMSMEIAGTTTPKTHKMLPGIDGAWWMPSHSFAQGYKDYLQERRRVPSRTELESVIRDWSNNRYPTAKGILENHPNHGSTEIHWLGQFMIERVSQRAAVMSAFMHPDKEPRSFLHNTLRVNANYQAVVRSTEPTVSTHYGDLAQSLQGTWDFIDWYSGKYGDLVDPNIIRAFFVRRDGMGSYRTKGSTADQGFGDLSTKFISSGTVQERIKKVIDRYVYWFKTMYRVPSIALLALTMETQTDFRRMYVGNAGELSSSVVSNLQTTAAGVAMARETPLATQKIQELVGSKYARVADTVDSYLEGYWEICRAYGSYLLGGNKQTTINHSDPLFFGFGGMVLADRENNYGSFVDGNFTASGKNKTLSLDRSKVLYRLPELVRANETSDLDKASLSTQLRLSQKLKAAMDPHSEAAIYGALLDLRKHSAFGRLAGAFPTYQILLINEGFYVGNTKLWDQQYTRAGVAEIEVMTSREQPASTCNITLSNMFHNLTAYAQMEALQHQAAVANYERLGDFVKGGVFSGRTLGMFWEVITRQLPKEIISIWQNNQLKQMALGVGTRLHVRMGWGSNASKLPVVFNGTVVNVPQDDGYVTLQAVGDGYELEKPTTTSLVQSGDSFAYQDGGALGTGKDPSSIITEAMIGANLFENATQGVFRDFGKGVAHYGEVYFEGGRHYATETQINIYGSSSSRLEQQLSMVQNYFNVNALYNFHNVNRFSISVKEPTLWKIMEVCRRACMDFVASSEHFTTRSTVFFGKWWWPYNYDYHESILGLSNNIRNNFTGVPLKRNITTMEIPVVADSSMEASTADNQKITITLTTEQKASWEVWTKLPEDGRAQLLAEFKNEVPLVRLDLVIDESDSLGFKTYWANLSVRTYAYDKQKKKIWLFHEEMGASRNVQESEALRKPTLDNPFQFSTDPVQQANDNRKEEFFDGQQFQAPKSEDITGFDYLKDVEVFTQYLKYKTYMQAYIAHSFINLLENKIEPSSEHVYTDAIGVNKYNGIASPEMLNHKIRFSVDSDIQPSQRRSMMVDTGIVLTTVQDPLGAIRGAVLTGTQGALTLAGGGVIPLAGALGVDGLREYNEQTPTTPAIINGTISALMDSVKLMYQGWFVMTGQPTMKPRDLVLLNDHHLSMRGPVFVREVVHRLDSQNGLITIVSPDCVVYPHGSEFGHQLVMSLSTGILHKMSTFYFMRGMTALTLGELNNWTRKRAWENTATDLGRYIRLEGGALTDKQKQGILTAYKERAAENIDEMRERLASTSAEEYDDLFERVKKAQQELDTLEFHQIQAYSKTYGLPDLAAEDMRHLTGHTLQQQMLLKEAQWARVYDEEVEAAMSVMGQTREEAEKTAETARNRRRAAWASANAGTIEKEQQKTLQEIAEVSFRNGEARLQLDKWKIGARLDDNGIPVDKKLRTSYLALQEVLQADEKLLAELIDSVIVEPEDIDQIIRMATQGPDFDPFWKRILDGTFGGTQAAVQGAAKWVANVINDVQTARETAKNAEKVAGSPRGVNKLRARLQELRTWATTVREADTAANLARLEARALQAGKFARNIFRAGSLVSYAGPQAALKIAFDVVVAVIGGSIVEGMNARWKARQIMKIIPLVVGDPGYPLVAGIRGHQGAVIGDDPSWADQLIFNTLTPNDSAFYSGHNVMAYTAALLGLESPEYQATESDRQFMDQLKNLQQESEP